MKKYIAIVALVSVVLSANVFAAQDSAQEDQTQPYVIASTSTDTVLNVPDLTGNSIQDTFVIAAQAPQANHTVVRVMRVSSTGYNSEVGQTDASPFITADGTHVFDGLVAANFLPMGAKIKIPDYFGDKVFTVRDRMNKRYWERVDIWFPAHSQAVQWGVRNIKIEILGS